MNISTGEEGKKTKFTANAALTLVSKQSPNTESDFIPCLTFADARWTFL